MTVKIECYRRADGTLANTMEKDLVEYTEWVERAVLRRYRFERAGQGQFIVFDGEGTRDFLVKLAE